MSNIPSPCKNICRLDLNHMCNGCGRTLEEIGHWTKYNDDEKREILKKIIYRTNVRGESPPGNFLR